MFAGGYALNLLVLDFPREDRCDGADWMITVSAVAAAAKQTGARAGILATLPENMPEPIAEQLIEAGIVPFCGISETLVAADIASGIAKAWNGPLPLPLLNVSITEGEVETLSEAAAKAELAATGLAVPLGRTATTPGEAADCAEQLGFPVALKALGVEHKSDVGAVKLNLWDRNAVRDAAEGMAGVAHGFLVERMIDRPIAELIVGAVRDPVVGLTLTVGAGGILVELLEDSVVLPLPVTKAEVLERISRLKVRKLIEGYRGNAGSSLEIVADAVLSAAEYVVKNAAKLEELDINPLMVLAESRGAIAADALIRRRR
jgi:acetyl-CoA synthetase